VDTNDLRRLIILFVFLLFITLNYPAERKMDCPADFERKVTVAILFRIPKSIKFPKYRAVSNNLPGPPLLQE